MHPTPDGPALDINFMLPGKMEKPDFTGMLMGGYIVESSHPFNLLDWELLVKRITGTESMAISA